MVYLLLTVVVLLVLVFSLVFGSTVSVSISSWRKVMESRLVSLKSADEADLRKAVSFFASLAT